MSSIQATNSASTLGMHHIFDEPPFGPIDRGCTNPDVPGDLLVGCADGSREENLGALDSADGSFSPAHQTLKLRTFF